jgi:predicted nucleic acid-binding protein
MIFLDTSAIYALADGGDRNHREAVLRFQTILDEREELLTHNYVVLESVALLQSRLGIEAAATFVVESTSFSVEWVDKELHESGIKDWRRSKKRRLSLVDHISFLVMTQRNLTTAFAFDPDFVAAGFRLFGTY